MISVYESYCLKTYLYYPIKPNCNKLLSIFFLSPQMEFNSNIGDNRDQFLRLNSKMGLCHVVFTTPKFTPEKLTLTVSQMQQRPAIGETDSKEKLSNWKLLIDNGRRKECANFKTETDKLNVEVFRYQNILFHKDNEVDGKLTKYQCSSQNGYIFWFTLTFFQAVHCTGWTNCPSLKQTSSRMDVRILLSFFWLYSRLKGSFEHSSARKNIILSAIRCWDARLCLCEMDQKFIFGGSTGCGVSHLEFIFCHFKVFRLHAILLDAAGAMLSHGRNDPKYCYIVGQGTNSCLLRDVTGLLFCFYPKHILPSIFKFSTLLTLKQYIMHSAR